MILAINNPSDDEFVGPHRCTLIVRDDVDEHSFARLYCLSPLVLESSISASVEARILGEMVEPFTRAVESSADVVTTVVSNAAIRFAGIGLRAP